MGRDKQVNNSAKIGKLKNLQQSSKLPYLKVPLFLPKICLSFLLSVNPIFPWLLQCELLVTAVFDHQFPRLQSVPQLFR